MIQYYVQMNYLNVAQLGRALRSGRRGRGFKSRHSDHCDQSGAIRIFLLPDMSKNGSVPLPLIMFLWFYIFL